MGVDREIVMESHPAWVGMADRPQAEPVLNLSLLRIDCVDEGCERLKLRIDGGDWRPNENESASPVASKRVLEIEDALFQASVQPEDHSQPNLAKLIKVRSDVRNRVSSGFQVHFVVPAI